MKNQKQRNIRPTRKLLSCALASCLMLGVTPAVFAQSTSATLRGQVSADSAPATDAKVTATNTATGLTRSVQANASGSYSVGGLPPGSYRIDVNRGRQDQFPKCDPVDRPDRNLESWRRRRRGNGGTGEATNLDTVTVTAPTLLETKTSEVATYVTQKQIDALPQVSRNFLAFADIVPGMIFDTEQRWFHLVARRRAELQRHQCIHRWRGAEELRAEGWHRRTGLEAAATRSRSWRSASTRSSRPTTRPSTTRSAARRLPL